MSNKFLQFITLFIFLFFNKNLNSQNFNYQTSELPRYRNGKQIAYLGSGKFIVVGGWLRNDSITSIFSSSDTCKTWSTLKDNIGGMLNAVSAINSNTIMACGRNGLLASTTDGGVNWQLNTLPTHSNSEFNAVVFESDKLGWIAGWNEYTGNSVVLKTENFGQTWTSCLDSMLGKINQILIVRNNGLFISGANGLFMHSQDNGVTWNSIALPSSILDRNLNAMTQVSDSLLLLAGGSPPKDSIQTLISYHLRTKSIEILQDKSGNPINSLVFSNGQLYLVGNKGTFLNSSDTGKTLTLEKLPNDDIDKRQLNAISLINPGEGIITGMQGRIVKFTNKSYQIPILKINSIRKTKSNDVAVDYYFNARGNNCSLYLYYWVDELKKDSVFLGFHKGMEDIDSSHFMALTNNFYTIQLGFVLGNKIIYSERFTINLIYNRSDNLDFELWDSTFMDKIDSWSIIGDVQKEIMNAETYVRLKSINKDSPGGLYLGAVTDNLIFYGIPFQEKPTSFAIKGKFHIGAKDSATAIVQLKNKTGQIVYNQYFKWHTQTQNDTQFNFPMVISSSESVDSLFIAILSTNYFSGNVDTSSTLFLDSIWFSGNSANIPNSGFSNWNSQKSFSPSNWHQQENGNIPSLVLKRSQGYYSNSTSILLSLHPEVKAGQLIWGLKDPNNQDPFTRVTLPHPISSVHGYYKFQANGLRADDSLVLNAVVFDDTSIIGMGKKIITVASNNWKDFNFPITYYNQNKGKSISISIDLITKTYNSELMAELDDISFDQLLDSNFRATTSLFSTTPVEVHIFPNPSQGQLTIKTSNGAVLDRIVVYDISLKTIENLSIANPSQNEITMDLSHLNNGVYWIQTTQNQINKFHKLIINR